MHLFQWPLTTDQQPFSVGGVCVLPGAEASKTSSRLSQPVVPPPEVDPPALEAWPEALPLQAGPPLFIRTQTHSHRLLPEIC